MLYLLLLTHHQDDFGGRSCMCCAGIRRFLSAPSQLLHTDPMHFSQSSAEPSTYANARGCAGLWYHLSLFYTKDNMLPAPTGVSGQIKITADPFWGGAGTWRHLSLFTSRDPVVCAAEYQASPKACVTCAGSHPESQNVKPNSVQASGTTCRCSTPRMSSACPTRQPPLPQPSARSATLPGECLSHCARSCCPPSPLHLWELCKSQGPVQQQR